MIRAKLPAICMMLLPTVACAPLSYAPGLSALRTGPAPEAGSLAAADAQAFKAPESRALYFKLIHDMREQGHSRAALAHLDEFERRFPKEPRARILRADCLVDIGDVAQAEGIYRRLLHGSEAADAYAGLGRIRGLSGDWRGAVVYLNKASTLQPTSSKHLNDYGFALLQSGDAAAALARLRQAAELAPRNPQVRNNLILALASAGEIAEARARAAAIADEPERRQVEAALDSALKGRLPASR